MNQTDSPVLASVRAALGRQHTLHDVSEPPAIDETVVRLVPRDADLVQVWLKIAASNQIDAERTTADELPQQISKFLLSKGVKRVGVIGSTKLSSDFEVKRVNDLTLDQVYDLDAAVTDAYAAVAEVGGIVVRGSPEHPRSLSLIPPIHVCIIKSDSILPDLVDLFEKLTREGTGAGTVIITGPSKTADIEMNLVTGVHGPGVVKVFILP